ncbi:MAG: bifunctional glutamate N-acetyltransferase/amino-acid acetyltransferase ArgJ [Myxococcales bacterium]|nr:bifunctional glutamate N-acetyltransferase/amino-acid acetyltransferase ArgJ [Myxococcales bacterium]
MVSQVSAIAVPSGFRFAAVSAGIRKDGRIDLALAVSDDDAVAAGVFTRNLVRAAPVEVAERRVRSGVARAIVVNAGCANACTGEPGETATLASTDAIARALDISPDHVLPASTGVIGALLPADKISARATELVDNLSPEGWDAFSRAILTTDRGAKVASATLGNASVLGIAKGAGMIHPDLGPPHATMLAFLFTDASVERALLERCLFQASEASFNAVSVDGDTSTNDTVLCLASGKSGSTPNESELLAALSSVCQKLARDMVADGEGANHVAEIIVRGIGNAADARTIARTVATSLLVKTALFGQDANWGRLLAAAGRAGVKFDPHRARIDVNDVTIVRGGVAVGAEAEKQAARIFAEPSYRVTLELGDGPGEARYLTSDLGHGYVDVNAGYRS